MDNSSKNELQNTTSQSVNQSVEFLKKSLDKVSDAIHDSSYPEASQRLQQCENIWPQVARTIRQQIKLLRQQERATPYFESEMPTRRRAA